MALFTKSLRLIAAAVVASSATMTAQADSICESCNDLDGVAASYIGLYNPTRSDSGSFGHQLGPDTAPNTNFTDNWIFDLNPAGSGTASANFTTAASISNFAGALYLVTADTCDRAPFVATSLVATGCASFSNVAVAIATASAGGGGDLDWEIPVNNLAAGTYVLRITGTTNASDNSAYTGQLAFQVPEPASLALLGIAALGLAGVARRRKI